MRLRKKRIALVALSLLAFLAALELFCRFYLGLGDPPLSRADPTIEYLFIGPRIYHRFGNTIEYNEFSMRTHSFAGRRADPKELRIMMVGDSVINGGALTDQKDLATSRLERRLTENYKRPAVVMNVSAGSWGPPNYWAYVQRFGIFESNILIIVVSTHDFADAPTWEPVVGVSPDFPDHTPTFALEEAIVRYVPRYLPHFSHEAPPPPINFYQGQIDQSMQAFADLIHFAQDRHIPVIVAQHLEQTEYDKPESEGRADFRKSSAELHVPLVQLGDSFGPALKSGKSPYRDAIHPNAYGQQLMAEALYPEIEKALAQSGISK